MRRAVLAVLISVAGLSAGAQRREPIAADDRPWYVHTWVLRVQGAPVAPSYILVHVSEGPFDNFRAEARIKQISVEGLRSGIHYYPLHLVQLVELRNN